MDKYQTIPTFVYACRYDGSYEMRCELITLGTVPDHVSGGEPMVYIWENPGTNWLRVVGGRALIYNLRPGDWLIHYGHGRFDVYADDAFQQTFRKVEEWTPAVV